MGMVGCNDLILLVDKPSAVIIYLLINLISEQCSTQVVLPVPYGMLNPMVY